MITVDEKDIDKITKAFYLLLKGKKPEQISLPENYPDNEIKQVVDYINRFLKVYNEASDLTDTLSTGNLDIEIPKGSLSFLQSLKTLRANLLHLTWTTQQIAKGSFGLEVDFMGDFSEAFNGMVKQLEDLFSEREKTNVKLQNQIDELARTRQTLLNMMEDLKSARKMAEEASRAKSDFLSNMSHEIRTPMNSVIGYIELVLNIDLASDKARGFLQVAKKSAGNLLTIINDILDVSKLEAGKIEIEQRAFYLPRVLEEVIQLFSHSAREKALDLALTDLPSDLAVCVAGDSNRLRQVLINLIGNAVKFTEKGSIVLGVKNLENKFLYFSIKDTGIGMSSDQVKNVFEVFSQADQSIARRFGGTGLGTSICKQMTELMGGEIWVESELGQGSTFYFTIPFVIPDCKEDCDPACEEFLGKGEKIPHKPARGFNILMAEDIEENATLATIRLNRQGHKVFVVDNGQKAITAFKTRKYDLILMDVHMPEMDGVEATRWIRTLESQYNGDSRIPIIAVTASAMRKEREKCLDAGMDMVITKPIRFDELFSCIEDVMHEDSGTLPADQDIKQFSSPGENLPFDHKGINFEKGLNTWQDKTAYIKALKHFAAKYSDAGERLTRFIDDKNIDKAYELSHALKGISGNLSVIQVENLATEIGSALMNKNVKGAMQWLSSLVKALEISIKSIEQIRLPDEKSLPACETIDVDGIKKLLNEVLLLFNSGMLSDELVSKLINKIQEHVPKKNLENLKNSIENFDFNRAKMALESIAASLEIPIEKG